MPPLEAPYFGPPVNVKNAATQDPHLGDVEGMLLCPRVETALCETYNIQGHRVTIATIDVAQDWRRIHADLLSVLA